MPLRQKRESQTSGPSSSCAERATWNDEMEQTLVEEGLLTEVRLGKRAENGFKKESYVRVLNLVNEKYRVAMDMQQVKNKIALLTKYGEKKLSARGFL